MPLGGSNVGWNEANPDNGRNAGLGAQDIRSLTTGLRNGLDSEHNWPSAGGAGTGYHRFGSARPFYGAQSAVSSSGTDGRLMVTSDTSRLFHVGSAGTSMLGAGPTSLSLGTSAGATPNEKLRHYWIEEIGLTGSLPDTITIPNSGYSGRPYVFLSAWSDDQNTGVSLAVNAVSATQFTIAAFRSTSGAAITSGVTVFWRSVGTRVFG